MSATDPQDAPDTENTTQAFAETPKRKRKPATSKATTPKTESQAASNNPDALALWREEGRSHESMMAQFALSPEFSNAATFKDFSARLWGRENLHLNDIAAQLMRQAQNVQHGDLSRAEAMLMTQAHALDAIFNNLARRASANLGTYLD
ncbi:MAG: hypothetical protein WBP72_13455, partial [Rhodocyclaceae bacterium]